MGGGGRGERKRKKKSYERAEKKKTSERAAQECLLGNAVREKLERRKHKEMSRHRKEGRGSCVWGGRGDELISFHFSFSYYSLSSSASLPPFLPSLLSPVVV